jgi:hypothetical protein
MGSRGVSGATYNRKMSLMKRISTIDREIKNMRASAENDVQKEAMQKARDSIYARNHGEVNWNTPEGTAETFMGHLGRDNKYWTQADALGEKLEATKLEKLKANRSALVGEMFDLMNGQRRLL